MPLQLGITLSLSIDPPLPPRPAFDVGQVLAERIGGRRSGVGGGGDHGRVDMLFGLDVDDDERVAVVAGNLATRLDAALVAESDRSATGPLAGRSVTVEAFEVITPTEVERRMVERRRPPVVGIDAARAILGHPGDPISKARFYQLKERADFPTPIGPGVYLASAMEHYAETRRREAGRPSAPPAGHRPSCSACLHDSIGHGDLDGQPRDGDSCGMVDARDGAVHPCECPGYRAAVV